MDRSMAKELIDDDEKDDNDEKYKARVHKTLIKQEK